MCSTSVLCKNFLSYYTNSYFEHRRPVNGDGANFCMKKKINKFLLDVLDTVFPKNTLKNTHFFVSSEKWPSAKMAYVYNGSSDSKLLYRISKFSQSATKNCLKKGPNTFVKRNPSNSKKKFGVSSKIVCFYKNLNFLP